MISLILYEYCYGRNGVFIEDKTTGRANRPQLSFPVILELKLVSTSLTVDCVLIQVDYGFYFFHSSKILTFGKTVNL